MLYITDNHTRKAVYAECEEMKRTSIPSIGGGRDIKILIVDDDPGTLNVLRVGLISYKFNVVAARSGKQALELVNESLDQDAPFCLLVTDFRMPQMNGLKLIQSARDLVPDLSALLITGYGSEDLKLNSDRIGITGYMEKPFTPKMLAQKITEILEQASENTQNITGKAAL